MNQIYYGEQLERLKRRNVWLEVSIAIGTSGTAIGAWPLWQTDVGRLVWSGIAGVATVLAIIKPLLGWTEDLARLGRLFAGHGDVAFDLELAFRRIKLEAGLCPEVLQTAEAARERMRRLGPDDDPRPNEEIRKRAFDQVTQEVPVSTLRIPLEDLT